MNARSIEGWLLKKKSNSMFKGENHRWFRIQEVKGAEQAELALCYYYSQRDKEAKGWIYLKDIVELVDNVKTFSVISGARTLVLEAKTTGEHALWLQSLSTLCPTADASSVRNIRSWSQSKSEPQAKDVAQGGQLSTTALKQLEAADPKPAGQMDRSISLFSRHAHGEKNSFYINNEPRALAAGSSDREDGDRQVLQRGDSNLSASSIDHGQQHRSRGRRVEPGEGDIDDDDRRRPSRGDNDDRRPSRGRDNRPSRAELDRRSGDDRRGGDDSRQRRYRDRDERDDRDSRHRDHRSGGYSRGNDSNSTVSGRLQRHIKDADAGVEEVLLRPDAGYSRAREKLRSRRDGDPGGETDPDVSDADDHCSASTVNSHSDPEDFPSGAGGASDYNSHPPVEEESKRDEVVRPDEQRDGVKSMEEFLAVKAEVKLDEEDDLQVRAVRSQAPKPKSKPPRPPQSQPPPYASIATLHQQAAPMGYQSAGVGLRMGTPPRPSGNPGTVVDTNFVSANWDDETESEAKATESKGSDEKQAFVGSNVRADANWLDEDFDN